MTLDDYLAQERGVRNGVHFHDGVWWKKTSLGCCQPLYPLQQIRAGESRPKRRLSFVRYSHLVPPDGPHNATWSCCLLQDEEFAGYRFEDLKHEKRKAINKARRGGLEVRRIDSLQEHWNDLRQVVMSTARRTGYGLPEQYYVEREAEWKVAMQREYGLAGRDWFGAFAGDRLVAYLYTCLVEETAFLLVTKHDDAFGELRPSDLLHHEAISYYRTQTPCSRIYAGRSVGLVPSIDRFKMGFGFKLVSLPVFDKVNGFVVWGVRSAMNLVGTGNGSAPQGSRRDLRYWLRSVRDSLPKAGGEG